MPRGKKIVKTIELENCSLGSAATEFFRHNQIKGLAKATQDAYKMYVGCFVKWYGEDVPMSHITIKTFEDYIQKKSSDGNKPVSIATTMVHIRRFIRFCTSRDYCEKFEITIPKYEQELKEPYTDDEIRTLLKRPTSNNWVEYRNWAMVNYFFSTGQRLSTVLNIKVHDLDLEKSRVKLTWNKDKIQKFMPLSSSLVKILWEYIIVSDLKSHDYLFPEYEGKQLKRKSAEDSIKKYNRNRGVTKTSIHLFRHCFARNYIINGGSPAKLQKLMNHKTIEQTMKYVNLYSEDLSKDLDLYNPLEVLNRNTLAHSKRKTITFKGVV